MMTSRRRRAVASPNRRPPNPRTRTSARYLAVRAVPSQAVRDTVLVYLERDIVPEVIVLFLHKKGNVEAADSVALRSRLGLTRLDLSWKAVKLWEIPAAVMMATDDAGLLA